MADIYIHPSITSSPGLVRALEERLGMHAIVRGRRVRLFYRFRRAGPAHPTGEPRGLLLFALRPWLGQRREDPPERPL